MRAAVIGCGRRGAEPSSRLAGRIPDGWLPLSHAEALVAAEGLELAALCDTSSELLRSRGEQYGITALFTDYEELIDTVSPDVLTVATRTPPKAAIVEYACRRGVKGIYVEKPLANSIAACRRALDAAAMAGVAVLYGVNRRYHAAYRQAVAMLRQGEIGDLVGIVVEHGRGQLLWSHPHSVDLALLFAGNPRLARVQASLRSETVERTSASVVDSDPVIDNAFFSFENGVTATIVTTGGLNVRVAGTAGTLTVHADGSYLQVNRANGAQHGYFVDQQVIQPELPHGATVTALSELARATRSSDLPPTDHIERGTSMLMGCVWSHLHGGQAIDASALPWDLVVTGRVGERFA